MAKCVALKCMVIATTGDAKLHVFSVSVLICFVGARVPACMFVYK